MVRFNKKMLLAVLSIAGLLAISTIAAVSIHAYLTDRGPVLENNFTIALDPATTVVEKFPTEDPEFEDSTTIKFMKVVQIGNTGYIDCYVRVKLNFADTSIRDQSLLSWNGTDFYNYSDYKNHMPTGWVYDASTDWFYYMPMLYAGDWGEFSKNLVYNKELGEYFYKNDDSNILSGNIITTPLIKYVKVSFDNPNDMRTVTLDVIEESVPFYLGNDYKSAWTAYDAETWDLN